MLSWLQIKYFAIADHIEFEPGKGLNVITGETGAGKSVIIRALSLVLGQRAEASMIKHGHSRAEIQAAFDISDNPTASTLLSELELDEDNECQLRRVINRDSGSKAYINGRMVTASVLRQVGEQLMDIHGQNEHQSLLRAETQRQQLDLYASTSDQVTKLQGHYHAAREAIEALLALRTQAAAASEQLDFLNFQVEELDHFAATQEEWPELNALHQRIHHQAELVTALQEIQQALYGDQPADASATTQVNRALAELENIKRLDPQLEALSRLIGEALTLLEEVEPELRRAGESVAFDEQELDTIEQRYTGYMDLARKHRIEPEQVYARYQALQQQLANAENPQQSEQRLLDTIQTEAHAYRTLAETISKLRISHADALAKAVSHSMQALAMEGGQFNVVLKPAAPILELPGQEALLDNLGRDTGRETISYEVSTNAGMPSLPLGRVASGGELSRISLALQLKLADPLASNALVFDEVDVGVGGKTAAVIGKMLAQLASSRQILCITHLPQVAAFGQQHYCVSKHQDGQVQLDISALDEDGKVEEIARMVGGEHTSGESLAHARSLLSESRP